MERPDEKWIFVKDIVGFTDIAMRLDVQRHRVVMWHHRREVTGFPEGIAKVNDSFVFDMTDVDMWYETWMSTRGWMK